MAETENLRRRDWDSPTNKKQDQDSQAMPHGAQPLPHITIICQSLAKVTGLDPLPREVADSFRGNMEVYISRESLAIMHVAGLEIPFEKLFLVWGR